MRILIVRLSAMGDLVQTLPALTDAANTFPQITFDWIVDESFAQIPTWHSHVDKVFPTAIRRWRQSWTTTLRSSELRSFVPQVRANNYDMIVDVQGGLRSAFLARLAKGTHAGYDAAGVHDWGAQFLYNKRVPIPKGLHSITRMRRLLAAALSYQLDESKVDYGIVRARLLPSPIELEKPYLVFVHSTSWASKIWPEHHWRELLEQATAAGFNVLLPWGDELEEQKSFRLAAGNERATVLPRMSISEKAAIIEGASGTVGLDTGLSHIAAALDVPSVTIYGATDPRLVGATGKRQVHLASKFECIFCHQTECTYSKPSEFKPACLVEIKPNDVWVSLQQAMAQRL